MWMVGFGVFRAKYAFLIVLLQIVIAAAIGLAAGWASAPFILAVVGGLLNVWLAGTAVNDFLETDGRL
jgi:hypothetical protein